MPTPPLETARLALEPLRVEHAVELAPALDDPGLHAFTGGEPADEAALRERYRRQLAGPPDPADEWHTWVLRPHGGPAVGFVQASVADGVAELAWVVGTAHQGRGLAREAATAVLGWLRTRDGLVLRAHVHPGHAASQGVARALGLVRTDVVVDGEDRWQG